MPKRSRRSRQSRQHVEITSAKTREWGQIVESSSDEEAPGGQDRRERYARIAREMEAEAKGVNARDRGGERKGGSWLSFVCCLFCILYNSINIRLLVMISELDNLIVVCCLVPSSIFLAVIETCLASTDRSIVHMRYGLRRSSSILRLVVFELFVVVVLGCLHGYRVLRACRHLAGSDPHGTFLMELEILDPSRNLWMGQRWDSHYLLWGVPIVVCLTCSLTLGCFTFAQEQFWFAVLVVATLSVITAVETFDFTVSQQVRRWHGMVLDDSRWVKNGHTKGKFTWLYRCCRVSEIVGRVLLLVTASTVIPMYPLCTMTVLVVDLIVNGVAMCLNSGLSLEVAFVGIVLFLVDVARYVDEPGFALPARRVSRILDATRILDLAAAMTLYAVLAFGLGCSGGAEPLAPPQAVVLPTVLVLAYALSFAIRTFSGIKSHGGDLFTAVVEADLEAMEHSLSFEGGCTSDMKICDTSGYTALHLAASCGHLECVRFLVNKGAKCNVLDAKLENPLHIVVRRGDLHICEILLQGPGDSKYGQAQLVQQMNVYGETPLDLLRSSSPPALVQLLSTVASHVARDEASSRTRIEKRSTVGSVGGLVQHVSTIAIRSMFGTVVGGEHYNLQVGPREEVRRAELAAFMFFRGMGEQLQRLHLYWSQRRHMCDTAVHLSNLRTLGTLGAGGFGKVLKVEDLRSGRVYALKLQPKNTTTKQAVREVQTLRASKQHPYIVQLEQIFRTSAFYGLLMEFCDKDLNVRILEQETDLGHVEGLPASIAARYTACVMFALEYLHSNNIVFRDLKPENVLIVMKDDHAKLADFGLARTVDMEVGKDGELVPPRLSMAAGTLGFMSSEAFDGDPDDAGVEHSPGWFAARDWYGLGCCLLLMLLGEGGGRKVYTAKRNVLLPIAQGQILDLLLKAMDECLITEDAFDLVSSLTAARVADRADSKAIRASAFVQDAIGELEPVGLQCAISSEGRGRLS